MYQAFLAETVETETKNFCLIEVTHVLERLNLELFQNMSGNDVISLESRPFNFLVFIHV